MSIMSILYQYITAERCRSARRRGSYKMRLNEPRCIETIYQTNPPLNGLPVGVTAWLFLHLYMSRYTLFLY